MDLLERFAAVGGGAIGRAHARAYRNAQDAFAIAAGRDAIVLAVTDGCSSGAATEVGAALGARWLAENTARVAREETDGAARAAAVTAGLVAFLAKVRSALGATSESDPCVVGDLLLFSFLVALVEPERTLVFGVGDGVVMVNGDVHALDAGPENAPDYAAYALLGPGSATPRVHHDGATSDLTSVLVATDGALDLERHAATAIDGVPQGGLAQFTREARYVKNPSLVQKRLNVLGPIHGRLSDDTTIALAVRRGE
jgi:hypothetical protein